MALAAAAGGQIVRSIALGCQARYRITGYGQLAGHPVTITTTGRRHDDPPVTVSDRTGPAQAPRHLKLPGMPTTYTS